jgi:hypothetical protein
VSFPSPADIATRYPAIGIPGDAIADLIAEFIEIAERYRGVTFGATTATEVFSNATEVYGSVDQWPLRADARPDVHTVQLARWPVQSVTSVTVDGDAVTPVRVTDTGLVYLPRVGAETVVVYVHGIDVPAAAKRACGEYVRAVALAERSGTSRDVIAQSFDGGMTRYSTPNWAQGRPTGFLEVDRLLESVPDYRVPGVA